MIGIDVGTSASKGVALDRSGRAFTSAVASYPTRRRLDGEVTQDPADWLAATRFVLRDLVAKLNGTSVDAVSITAPAHVGVLIDRDGRTISRALLAFDQRPAIFADQLRDRFGDWFFKHTLVGLTTGWTFPQLAWLRDQLGDQWARVRWLLPQKDFIRWSMTGFVATDPTDAQGTALFSPIQGRWIEDLVAAVDLTLDQLPGIDSATTVAGGLSGPWARATGLREGLPVIIGATDSAAELVSVGAREAGDSIVKIASTGTVVVVSDQPYPDPRLLIYPHALPERWYQLAATNTAAISYTWLRETAFSRGPGAAETVYREMDAAARSAPPGAGGLLFLPFLDGERTPYWDPDLRAAVIGLSAAHGRAHLSRAVLEGVAFSLRVGADVLAEVGLDVKNPRFGGGGIASRLWREIVASVLGIEGWMTTPQGPALGAAILASIGIGDSRSPKQGVQRVLPNPRWVEVYAQVYPLYREVVELLTPTSHALAKLGQRDRTPSV